MFCFHIRGFYSQYFAIILFGLSQSTGEDCILTETKNLKYGCYGTHSGNVFMDATCSSNHKLAVCSIYAGAKKLSTGCDRATDGFNFTFQEEEKCCKPNSIDDCIFKFKVDGGFNENYKYHINCTGKTSCDKVRVVSMDSPSSCSDAHWDTSNYLYMNYFCIPESRIGGITSCTLESFSTPSSLYIWNANYPSSSSPIDTTSCSIQSGCGSSITVTAIDIRLTQDSSNNCQQSITLIDNTTTHRLDCSDNNNFEIKQIFQSTTNYLTMKFTNTYKSNGGYFWFGFSTSGSGCGSLKVNCPAIGQTISCDEDTSTKSLCETTTSTTQTTQEMSTITSSTTSTTMTTPGISTISSTTTSTTSTTPDVSTISSFTTPTTPEGATITSSTTPTTPEVSTIFSTTISTTPTTQKESTVSSTTTSTTPTTQEESTISSATSSTTQTTPEVSTFASTTTQTRPEVSTITSTTTSTSSSETSPIVVTSTAKTSTIEGHSIGTTTSTSTSSTTSPQVDTADNAFETTSEDVSTESTELTTFTSIKLTNNKNDTSSVATSSAVITTTMSPVEQAGEFPWWIIVVAVFIILIAISAVVLYICWKKNKNKIAPWNKACDKIDIQAKHKDKDIETIMSTTDVNTTDQGIHNTNEDPLGPLLKTRRRSSVHYNPSLPYLDAIVDANILKATRKLAPIDLTPLANTENRKRKKKKKKKQKIENNDTNNSLIATAGGDANAGGEYCTK